MAGPESGKSMTVAMLADADLLSYLAKVKKPRGGGSGGSSSSKSVREGEIRPTEVRCAFCSHSVRWRAGRRVDSI